jgi:hypothetical protein
MTTTHLFTGINKTADKVRVGDIGFARTTGALGFLIRVGEKLKWRDGKYNHVFVVTKEGSNWDEVEIIQATLRGVIRSKMKDLIKKSSVISIFTPPEGCDPKKVAEFVEKQLGDSYGLGSIFCIGLDILTPEWFISFRRNGTWVCSAVSAEALRYGGWLQRWPDIYGVTPTTLFLAHKWS